MCISTVILTLDEEVNLPGALQSLAGHCNDVVVFDSFSSDSTCAIAATFGARVVQRKFDDYASQRSAALALEFRHPWVLMIDADERMSPSLWEEMEGSVKSAGDDVCIFRMRRKDIVFGKWLKRSSGYPTWFGRLLRRGRVRIEREVNEQYLTDGAVAHLSGHLLHYPMNRGIAHWVDRHNQYSTMEARRLMVERQGPISLAALFSRDPTERRKTLKAISYRLPGRPLLVFCYLYLFRLGFLDGAAGYRYCRLRAFYEHLIDIKVDELAAANSPS
jgi:glycosyltransferase involved in cell wall biosynthesis